MTLKNYSEIECINIYRTIYNCLYTIVFSCNVAGIVGTAEILILFFFLASSFQDVLTRVISVLVSSLVTEQRNVIAW